MFAQVSTGVPTGMTPEQALNAKLITPAQFVDVKMNLPSGVTWTDYLTTEYPTLAAILQTGGAMLPGGPGVTTAYQTYKPIVTEAVGAVEAGISKYYTLAIILLVGLGAAYILIPPTIGAYVRAKQ